MKRRAEDVIGNHECVLEAQAYFRGWPLPSPALLDIHPSPVFAAFVLKAITQNPCSIFIGQFALLARDILEVDREVAFRLSSNYIPLPFDCIEDQKLRDLRWAVMGSKHDEFFCEEKLLGHFEIACFKSHKCSVAGMKLDVLASRDDRRKLIFNVNNSKVGLRAQLKVRVDLEQFWLAFSDFDESASRTTQILKHQG